MTTQQETASELPGRIGEGNLIAIGAAAGVIGPLLFVVGFVVQGLFRVGEYDPIAETVSALEAGPNGWIQQLNFVVFGVLMMIFGVGLAAGLRTSRRRIAAVIGVWWGIGLLLAGLFPLRESSDGQTYDATGVHHLNGVVFFLSIWVGLAALSWCLRTERDWRGLSRYALITSVASALLFVAMVVLAIPSSAPLHPWAGLGQRLVLAVWFACLIPLAVRLGQVSRSPSPTSIGDHPISVA
jgi:hypothetical membrane protein